MLQAYLMDPWPVGIAMQLAIPLAMLLGIRSSRWGSTALAGVAAYLLIMIAITSSECMLVMAFNGMSQLLAQFICFSLVVAMLALLIVTLFRTGVWTALFCATMAYAMQNLSSSVQLFATTIIAGFLHHDPFETSMLMRALITAFFCALVYVPCYLLLIRKIDRRALDATENRKVLLIYILVSLAIIGFDLVIKGASETGVEPLYAILLRGIHILICVFVLITEYYVLCQERERLEHAAVEQLLSERERQLELSRENIDAINIKCHDLRHQIRTLANGRAAVDGDALDDLANEVAIYDSIYDTGNETIDTVLTEKGLACERAGITLSAIVDGKALDFVASRDLYALFGNILDNAVEATSALRDPDRKSISLVVKRHSHMVSIHEENYCNGRPSFEDGLPVTTKPDKESHGFGSKSMRLIAQKYGGALVQDFKDGTFLVTVMLPLPE